MIRLARKDDAPRILQLIKDLAEYEKAPLEAKATLEQIQESIFGEIPVAHCHVAEDDGLVVGHRHGRIHQQKMVAARQHFGERRPGTLVGYVQEVELELVLQQQQTEVTARSGARRGEVDLARVSEGVGITGDQCAD